MTYMIYQDDNVFDGELYHTAAALYAVLGYADMSAKVFEFDVAEASKTGTTQFRDVTEDVVFAAYHNGAEWERDKHQHKLPGVFITFPMSGDDERGDRADYDRAVANAWASYDTAHSSLISMIESTVA